MMRSNKVLLIVATAIVLVVLVFLFLPGPRPQEEEAVRVAGKPTAGDSSPGGQAFVLGEALSDELEVGASAAVACALEGSVEGERGQPIAGATVTVREARAVPAFRAIPAHTVSTDADGSFRVDIRCGRFQVTATAPGQVSPFAEEVEVAGTARVHLVLGRSGHTLSGVVTDRSGGAVPLATVQAIRSPGGATFGVATDSEGRYSLLVPVANYWVEASAPDYARSRRRLMVNRRRTVDFRLEPAATLRGRVVMEGSNEPVSGALVRGHTGHRWLGHESSSQSDASGNFELTGLAPGEYDLTASRGPLRGRYPTRVPVQVASYTPDVVIAVRPGLSIRGYVRAENGAGIAAARVEWLTRGPGGRAETRSRADGAFELSGLESGRGLLAAEHEEFVDGMERADLAAVDLEGVELVLKSGARIRGTVVDQEGGAVTGALVTVVSRDGFASHGGGRGAGAGDISDGDGQFLLQGVPPGDVTVRAHHIESGIANQSLAGVEAGEEYVVQLTLTRGASVAGTVTWTDGSPAGGATVHAFSRGMGRMGAPEAEVTESGAYLLTGLDARPYVVWVLHPGNEDVMPFPGSDSPQRQVDPEPGQQITGIDFELARADQTISGKVVDEAGMPVADAEVSATSTKPGGWGPHPGSSGNSTRSQADGSFLLSGLTPGTYRVSAELPGFPPAAQESVEAGAAGVLLVIPPGAVLAGRVVGVDGAPVPRYQLRTMPSFESAGWAGQPGSEQWVVENADGAFAVSGLQAGTYRLVATTAEGLLGELVVEAVAGTRRDDLLIQLSGGNSLEVTLTGHASGTSISADLFLVTDAGRTSLSSQKGRYVAEGLASGDAVLMVSANPNLYVSDGFRIVLSPGETALSLRLVEVAALPSGAEVPPLAVEPVGDRFVAGAATGEVSAGDEVISIAGIPLAGLGIRGARALLQGAGGSEVEVGLIGQASGEVYSVTLVRGSSAVEGR